MGAKLKNIPLIDSHTHVWELEDIDKLLHLISKEGLQKINVLSLTAFEDRFFDHNLLILLLKLLAPGKVFGFGGLFYPSQGMPGDPQDLVRQAEILIHSGFDGIKMIEGKPGTHKRIGSPLNSNSYLPLFSFLEDKNVPILLHAADPEEFWDPQKAPDIAREYGWTYWDGSYATKEKITDEVETILRKHSSLNYIVAHFFFLSGNMKEAMRLLDTYPNLYFDISPGSEMYSNFSKQPGKWRDFFTAYDHRILFGTDNLSDDSTAKMRTIRRFLETNEQFYYWGEMIHGIGLSEKSLNRIYWENSLSLTGKEPKPVSTEEVLGTLEETAVQTRLRNPGIRGWNNRLNKIRLRLADL